MTLFIFPVYLIIAALLVSAFWHPIIATVIFLVSSIIFEAYLFFANSIKSELIDQKRWSPDEKIILQKYSLYFSFFRIPRLFSYVLTAIQLSSLLWAILLLCMGYWLFAVVIGLNYFIVGPLSARLDPKFFLRDAIIRGKIEFSHELDLIDGIDKKLDEDLQITKP